MEFMWRGSLEPVTGFRYNGNFDLPSGAWTDDTSMTLCLAKSLVDNNGTFNLQDQISKYLDWCQAGYMSSTGRCFDIGNATRQALHIWKDSFELASGKVEEGGRLPGQAAIDSALNRERSCGNGSLMRCVSIPLVFHSDLDLALQNAAKASISTHPHITCIEACQLYTRLIVDIQSAVSGPTKASVFASFTRHQLQSPPMSEAFSKYQSLDDFVNTSAAGISSSGFVVHTLEAALWAFFTTESFLEGALIAVNLGDDADTVGAVYGGLAGSYYGIGKIPKQWIEGLLSKETIDSVVEEVVSLTSDSSSDHIG